MTAAFLLNPARFSWLDRLPAPRMPRLFKRGQHKSDALTRRKKPDPKWTGPKHASGTRVSAGGVCLGTLPRREPGETRLHLIDRGPHKPPFLTGELAMLAGECRVPAQTDAGTLEMYHGKTYGQVPQLEAARLAEVTLP